jgi:hypothetical protein
VAREVEARRAFLKNCAKFATATPPAIALLLSVGNAKADHFSAGNPQCNDPTNPDQPPHCPQNLGGSQTTLEETADPLADDPELADPELEAQ